MTEAASEPSGEIEACPYTEGCTGHQIGHHHEALGETWWVCSECNVGVWY